MAAAAFLFDSLTPTLGSGEETFFVKCRRLWFKMPRKPSGFVVNSNKICELSPLAPDDFPEEAS